MMSFVVTGAVFQGDYANWSTNQFGHKVTITGGPMANYLDPELGTQVGNFNVHVDGKLFQTLDLHRVRNNGIHTVIHGHRLDILGPVQIYEAQQAKKKAAKATAKSWKRAHHTEWRHYKTVKKMNKTAAIAYARKNNFPNILIG
jgi:hypothetical protein